MGTVPGWPETEVKPEAQPFPLRDDKPEKRDRVSIAVSLDADGNPDWANTRDKTKDKFREIFRAASTQAEFGAAATEEAPVTPEIAQGLLQTLYQVQALAFSIKFRVPLDKARALCSLTKPELDAMTPHAQKVLGKRAPEFLQKWGDEIVLASLLLNSSAARYIQFQAYVDEQKRQAQSSKQVSPDNGKSNIPVHLEVETEVLETPLV